MIQTSKHLEQIILFLCSYEIWTRFEIFHISHIHVVTEVFGPHPHKSSQTEMSWISKDQNNRCHSLIQKPWRRQMICQITVWMLHIHRLASICHFNMDVITADLTCTLCLVYYLAISQKEMHKCILTWSKMTSPFSGCFGWRPGHF